MTEGDKPLPPQCLKGVPNSTFLTRQGFVASHLFYFEPEYERLDGWIEQSICWDDDAGCVPLMFQQTDRQGSDQFQVGIAVLPTQAIEQISRKPGILGFLSWGRDAKPENPYHGNLLYRGPFDKTHQRMIAAALAVDVTGIIPRPRAGGLP